MFRIENVFADTVLKFDFIFGNRSSAEWCSTQKIRFRVVSEADLFYLISTVCPPITSVHTSSGFTGSAKPKAKKVEPGLLSGS